MKYGKNPATFHEKIREAQELVRENYTVDAIERVGASRKSF